MRASRRPCGSTGPSPDACATTCLYGGPRACVPLALALTLCAAPASADRFDVHTGNAPKTVAFGLQFPMEGAFPELDDVFVIAAIAPGPVLLARQGEVGPMNQMVQSLLEERFTLRVRWETRSFEVYALRCTHYTTYAPASETQASGRRSGGDAEHVAAPAAVRRHRLPVADRNRLAASAQTT